MYSVTKPLILTLVALSLAGASCSDPKQTEARELCERAEAAVADGDYYQATALLDTLDRNYRSYTDVRRQGMAVRARAIEGLTLDSITTCDERLAYAKLALDSLGRRMHFVDGTAGLDGYWVADGSRSDGLLNANTIQGRVDPKGWFRLVANQNATKGFRALRFEAPGVEVEVGPVSPSRIVRVEGAELISFTQEEAAPAMQALAALNPKTLTCFFVDSNSNVRVTLNEAATAQLLTAWRYSVARQEYESTLARREKLERRLAQARNHLARFMPDPEEK